MKTRRTWYPVFVVVVFFLFIFLHQTDKLLIGSLQIPISETFHIDDFQWGLINSGALIVGTLLYPVWGYLYDRYARPKLLALASFLWGATTWLSSLVRTYPQFLITRASTGIDDSSYPGLYSLAADYFGPKVRGKVYGILQLPAPLGYLTGMVLALVVAPLLRGRFFGLEGWRCIFVLTGSLGVLMALLIFFGIRDLPRGKAEPEFEGVEAIGQFRFSWQEAKQIFKKRTMWFVFLQGFAGVFPWNVITYFFIGYLQTERNYDNSAVLMVMGPVVLILALGHFVGGALGDWLFRRTVKGRILVSSAGVILGAIFLLCALLTPVEARTAFFVWVALTALFMPFSAPNVVATIFDITAPEVRSTAHAIEYFVENSGAALAPMLAGAIAASATKQTAILTVCITAWLLCFVLYLGALFSIEGDVRSLRALLAERAAQQRARAS